MNAKKPQAVKPSPLPLGMIVNDRGHFEIRDDAGRGRTIAYAETHDDAALIVRAVNAHAGLVEALMVAESNLDQACDNDDDLINQHPAIGAAMVAIHEALRAAGEEV